MALHDNGVYKTAALPGLTQDIQSFRELNREMAALSFRGEMAEGRRTAKASGSWRGRWRPYKQLWASCSHTDAAARPLASQDCSKKVVELAQCRPQVDASLWKLICWFFSVCSSTSASSCYCYIFKFFLNLFFLSHFTLSPYFLAGDSKLIPLVHTLASILDILSIVMMILGSAGVSDVLNYVSGEWNMWTYIHTYSNRHA